MNIHPPEKQRVLVTGGAGYIGSHTCKALANAGFHPITFDNLSVGHRQAVKWGPLIQADLSDSDAIASALGVWRPVAVVHLAASACVGESVANPRKYFRNNVQNTLNLLDAMVEAGIAAVVFSSTCAIYGVPDTVPISETHAQRPINPYGESKLFVERMLHWYGRAYGLTSLALRYFNAAGADPDGEIGEDHNPETHLIPLAISAALGYGPSLRIFGSDYSTPDGTCIRDYTHVSDLAEAHVAALRKVLRATPGEAGALNLGAGQGCSVLEVIDCISKVVGRRVPFQFSPRRPGDPPKLVAHLSAQEALGWSPRRSSLPGIVQTAFQWHARAWKVPRRLEIATSPEKLHC